MPPRHRLPSQRGERKGRDAGIRSANVHGTATSRVSGLSASRARTIADGFAGDGIRQRA